MKFHISVFTPVSDQHHGESADAGFLPSWYYDKLATTCVLVITQSFSLQIVAAVMTVMSRQQSLKCWFIHLWHKMSKLAGVSVRNEASKFYPVSTILAPDKANCNCNRHTKHTHRSYLQQSISVTPCLTYPSVMVRSNPVLSSGVWLHDFQPMILPKFVSFYNGKSIEIHKLP